MILGYLIMKVRGNLFLAVLLMMTACEKPIVDEDPQEQVVVDSDGLIPEGTPNTKKFTFTLKGDFSEDWKINTSGNLTEADADEAASRTRGYLQADGKDLTDVWVLDYMDGTLVQQLHQGDNTASDFGKPVLQLSYGSHHVYFIASRGVDPVMNTEAHTLTF